MRRLSPPLAALALIAGLALTACGPAVVYWGPRVIVVPTRTPGVAYVLIRPTASGRRGGPVDPTSEYAMLCDARGTGPMACGIPPEVGRQSFGPQAPAAPAVPFRVGGAESNRPPQELQSTTTPTVIE